MKYLHTMIRVTDIDAALDFFVNKLGMIETRRKDVPEGKFTLIFLAADQDLDQAEAERAPELELTYNWDSEESYTGGRNFPSGLYGQRYLCHLPEPDGPRRYHQLAAPRRADGVCESPDGISLELLQEGEAQAPAEPGPLWRTPELVEVFILSHRHRLRWPGH